MRGFPYIVRGQGALSTRVAALERRFHLSYWTLGLARGKWTVFVCRSAPVPPSGETAE